MVHNDICLVNNYIRKLVARLKSVYLLDLDVLERHHFTTQGLHVNNEGKSAIATLIKKKVKEIFKQRNKLKQNKVTSNNLTTMQWSTKQTGSNKRHGSMSKVIEQHQDDRTVTFAHSISADFGDPHHMTAGVAVVFDKHFGKPPASHTTLLYRTVIMVPLFIVSSLSKDTLESQQMRTIQLHLKT